MNMVARKKVFRLTDEQNYKLCKWAENASGDLEERRLSKKEAANKACEAMGLTGLTIYNVVRAAKACGITCRFRRAESTSPITVHKNRCRTLAKHLAAIYQDLKGHVPADLAAIVGEAN